MMAVPKGAGTIRLKAEVEQAIEEEGIGDFTRVFTDGSKMDNLVGCTVVCGTRNENQVGGTNMYILRRSSSHYRSHKSHAKMEN
jgi:hypothetical protein